MLKFHKWAVYFPDPTPPKPHITPEQKAKAAETPPHAVPFHCKPWVDGQTLGWTLFYGYLSPLRIVGLGDYQFEVADEQVRKERGGREIIGRFANTHFGFASGYILQTPPGLVSYICPAKNPPANLDLLDGVVETDWYPKGLFLVFRVPQAGEVIELDYGAELARVVLVPRHQKLAAQPLTATELEGVYAEQDRYSAEKATSPTRWQSASGKVFDHVYKQWSQSYVRQRNAEHEPDA